MRHVSVVALYGAKPADLTERIHECQKQIKQSKLGDWFSPYTLQQVHATLVTLDQVPSSDASSPALNLNFFTYRGSDRTMDFAGLLEFLHKKQRFPFHIQLGGFENRTYPFTSWNQRPYQRTFSIKDGKVVLRGWPVDLTHQAHTGGSPADLREEKKRYPSLLAEIRQSFQAFNILHSYHGEITDVDNDFYFRIGLLDAPASKAPLVEDVGHALRDYLSQQPVLLEVRLQDIYIVASDEETMPWETTIKKSITDPDATSDFIKSLYQDSPELIGGRSK